MKDTLVHLSLYVLFAAICIGSVVLVLLVMGASLQGVAPLAGPIVIAGWAGGMVPATLRVLQRARRPVLAISGAACLTAGVVVGMIIFSGSSRLDGVEPPSVETVQAGRVYQGQEYSVIIDRVVGTDLGPVIVADHTEELDATLQLYPEGYWDRLHNLLILPSGPDIDLDDLKGFGVPDMPESVRGTAGDVVDLWTTAVVLWNSSMPFVPVSWVAPVLTVLLITLLLIVVWTPLRLTRWPLLNMVVALAYLRALAALPAAMRGIARIDGVEAWLPEMSAAELFAIGGAAVFLGLAVVSLLLPSVSHWRHHMHFQEHQS
ncbi:MAG: hypothetical protein ACOCU4_06685 [Alkalispirochaeta sp.]